MSIGKVGLNMVKTVPVRQVVNAAENSLLAMTKLESRQALNVLGKVGLARNKKVAQTFKAKVTCPIPEAADRLRQTFLATVEKAGVSAETTKELRKAKTWGELQAAIFGFADRYTAVEINPILKMIKPKHRKGMPLEIEQMVYQKKNLRDDSVRYLHGLFAQKSTHPEVVKIENILREQYGIDAMLNNDLEQARKILPSVWAASKNGMELPAEIIISNYKELSGEHLRISYGKQHSILIGSNVFKQFMAKYCPEVKLTPNAKNLLQRWYSTTGFKNWFSTTTPQHLYIHELCHMEHTPLLAFKYKPIPKRFQGTINNLSGYAASKPNLTHEVFTELNTKMKLSNPALELNVSDLTPDEKELFKFLGGKVS